MRRNIAVTIVMLTVAACGDPGAGGVVSAGDPVPDVGGEDGDAGRVVDDAGGGSPDTTDGCAPDECDIDGACFANESSNPENPCQICLVLVDRATWNPDDTAECDDGDPCTSDDVCDQGECVGNVRSCDDGDPCTEDLCDAETGECSTVPGDGAVCNDGDPCSVGDVCVTGVCVSGTESLACDDGNGCTTDRCEVGVGCVTEAATGAGCDDGDPCTVGDACGDDGRCVPGGDELPCDDGSLCTVDGCDPGEGCVFEDVSELCADDNPCTDEGCDPDRGCLYPFNEVECDDSDACTEGDACGGGVCRGEAINLDDDNICTDVTCDPILGVMVAFNTLSCDDIDACTVQDRCGEGSCQPGGERVCDDGNECTDSDCDPIDGCRFPHNTEMCDDGDLCTVEDRCGGGECDGSARDCSDGNECTADQCDSELGCTNPPILSNACRPVIDVEYPPRAATLIDEDPVVVRGTVASGGGDIVSLRINGQDVELDGDRFELPISPEVGGSILVIEAEDAIGNTRKRVQSYLWSTQYVQQGPLEQGMGIWLSQEVLDDGDRGDPPDDFAHIFEIVLASYDFGSLIPEDLGTFSGFRITVRSVEYGAPQASLIAGDDVLNLTVTIPDLRVGVRVAGFVSANGTLTASRIEIQAAVGLDVVDGELVVNLSEDDITVDIQDTSFQFDSFIFNLLAGRLVNEQLPDIIEGVENDLRGTLVDQIGPILQDALGALALDEDISLPSIAEGGEDTDIRLYTVFDEVDVTPAGMELRFDAGAYSLPEELHERNLGVMARVGCAEGPQVLVIPMEGEAELVLSDDIVNGLLYAAWTGGWLDFEVPLELLGDFDFDALGIENLELTTTGLLQPTASDCNDDGELILTIGDLQIDGSLLLFGEPVDFTLYASLQAGLEISADEGQIGFGLTSIEQVDQEIVVADERFLGLEAVIEGLVGDNLVPALLELLGGDALGGFPIPVVNIGDAIEDFEGELLITIEPLGVERIEGNNVVDSRLGGGQ